MRIGFPRLALSLALISAAGPPAAASAEGDLIDEGPGSPIAVVHDVVPPGEEVDALSCTLTAIGYDRAGRLVGLTAGHCAEIGTVVYSEDHSEVGPIGRIVKAHHDMDRQPMADEQHPWPNDIDFAVIEFDPGKVSPSAQTQSGDDDITISAVGGEPHTGDQVCAMGRTSGTTCGDVVQVEDWTHISSFCVQKGDSGSPVIEGRRIVGLVTMALVPDSDQSCKPEFGSNIDAVLRAIGPGVGDGFHAVTG